MEAVPLKEPRDSLILPVSAAFRPLNQDSATTGNGMFSDVQLSTSLRVKASLVIAQLHVPLHRAQLPLPRLRHVTFAFDDLDTPRANTHIVQDEQDPPPDIGVGPLG